MVLKILSWLQEDLSYVARGKKALFFQAVRQKPRYIEHTNSDFESKK
jgi:hypothetical protein